MIPQGHMAKLFCKIGGDEKLFAMAKDNLSSHLKSLDERLVGTYLACNGVTQFGHTASGPDRFYTFRNTQIDGAYLSADSDVASIKNAVADDNSYRSFKKFVESNAGLNVEPYVSDLQISNVISSEDGRPDRTVYAPVKVGLRVTAESSEAFQNGLKKLEEWVRENKPKDYVGTDLKGDGINFSFLDHRPTDTLDL